MVGWPPKLYIIVILDVIVTISVLSFRGSSPEEPGQSSYDCYYTRDAYNCRCRGVYFSYRRSDELSECSFDLNLKRDVVCFFIELNAIVSSAR